MGACLGRLRLGAGLVRASIAVCSALGLIAVSVPSFAVSASAAVCVNEGFRTGPSAGLPDCRAYEMVSPPDKNGGQVDGGILNGNLVYAPEQAAKDGEAVTYASTSAFASVDPASAITSSQYLSRRSAGGWVTREIVPAQELPEGKLAITTDEGIPEFSLFQGFSENLDYGFLMAWNPQPDPSAPAGYFNPYLFESEGGYRLLSPGKPPSWSPGGQISLTGIRATGFGSLYGGMSEDGQHVFFAANDALASGAVPGRVNLYEWNAGGSLELVSMLPDGTVDSSGGTVAMASELGYAYVSRDGRRAVWTGGSTGEHQLYMREKTEAGARSVEVSASQNPNVPTGTVGPQFQTANASGSRVYFTSPVKLTTDSTAAGAGREDLYQYDAETGVLSDITADPNSGEAADVLGVLGMGESEGIPYVYFAARGVLAPGGTAGADNVYVWRGDTGSTSFVAQLGAEENEDTDFAGGTFYHTSRVSPNGRFLAFQSARPLTGYDNLTANGRQCPEPVREGAQRLRYTFTLEGRCLEVFEYDSGTGKLSCASCNPEGLPPAADSLVPETPHLLENVSGWQSGTVQQRYLLDDGRLFFQSEDTLLAAATDGRQNVYEYEPEGEGQCAATGQGSCLYLISTGIGSGDSYFADASEDGRDVFFTTGQQLVPQDGDEAVDMYDAREGGGFATLAPPPCSGEACKPAITPAPAIYGAPASATFQALASPASTVAVKTKKVKATVKHKPKKHKEPAKRRSRGKRPHVKRARRASRGVVHRAGRAGGRS